MTNANYWSLIQNESQDQFACQRQVNQTYETGAWHPTAEAASRELDELNEKAGEEAAALERVLPDHLR
ncbi:hypothetical protein [Burkholderia cenocepacia]|uniref:hypothetical protein n=1 Tax=Burkholderia cenocepacia TaxID=95486 RepID=UPI002650C359|nr:hypothetical protein [Burkholderia cenocepacia]MDN7684057.1 hypothetical protein [Burkholderia cenocepacia]